MKKQLIGFTLVAASMAFSSSVYAGDYSIGYYGKNWAFTYSDRDYHHGKNTVKNTEGIHRMITVIHNIMGITAIVRELIARVIIKTLVKGIAKATVEGIDKVLQGVTVLNCVNCLSLQY